MRRARASATREELAEPLDENEQQAVVAALERAALAQATLWRVRARSRRVYANAEAPPPTQRCFAAVGAALAGTLAWAAVWQTLHPWQVVFHADFYHTLNSRTVVVADAAALSVGGASHALLTARKPQLRASTLLALAVSAFWAYSWCLLYRRRVAAGPADDALKLLWLPLAPLYSLLCAYVDVSLRDTDSRLASLRAARYAHKTA